MRVRKQLTAKRLMEVLNYDPATGIFRWKVATSDRIKVGSIAGHTDERGYVLIGLDGKLHTAHRLAWLYTYGLYPSGDIDHRDLNKSNNALSNLRAASRSENKANVSLPTSNTSGVKGVSWNKRARKWVAHIRVNYRKKHLGLFETKEAAAAAYSRAAEQAFGEFSRLSA